jgi:hypothetical protein
MKRFAALAAFGIALLLAASKLPAADAATESLPPGATAVELSVEPASVELAHVFDYRQLLVTAKLSSGDLVDVTRIAKIEAPDCVAVSPRGQVTPAKDGEGQIKLTLGNLSAAVPVKVSGQSAAYHPSFVADVMPVMSKLGCNAGTCHGAAQGKNGFKLSLRGYDPEHDHRSLIDDLAGRRFNRAAPDQSLMLLKPSGAVPHVGGAFLPPGSRYYNIFRTWIAEGVKLDLERPRVTGIEVSPKNTRVPYVGLKQQVRIVATYADGSKRDVTGEAFVESSLPEVVEVDKTGLATTVRRGEVALLARYEGSYAATTFVVVGDRTGFAWKDVPEDTFIDTLVYKKLRDVKILPSDLCTDEEFIRRVYLDLTGLPPEPANVRAFLADTRETRVKRDELVDRLVGSQEFIEHWTNKWADLLQVNRKYLGEEGAFAMRNWIRQALAENMPYDQFAYTILTAGGSTLENPPASYYKVHRQPDEVMENTTQLFLAIRFNCNKCHDHPFERWTQDQYYKLASYFAQVGRKPVPEFAQRKVGGTAVEGATPLVEAIYDTGGGEVTHLRTGQVVQATFPYEHAGAVPQNASRREQVARWITSKDNPYFAKSYVNRIWSYLLGPGIIDPIDDIRAGNPPSNPELLDRLTQEFIEQKFDVRHVMKLICKSRVYQHSLATNEWNSDDTINYSHAYERRLPAETLYDAVYRVTGATTRLPGLPAGFRAVQLPDSEVQLPDGFFNVFGKPPRESACECERTSAVMLAPVLSMINGPTVASAISDPNNRIAKLVAAGKDDRKLIEEIFLAVLSRRPTEQEIAIGLDALNSYGMEGEALQAELARYEREDLPKRFAAWLESVQATVSWTPLDPAEMKSEKGATFTRQPDGSVLVGGENPAMDTYTIVAKTSVAGITAFKLEVFPDDSLPAKGPGRAANGNFVLNHFVASAESGGKSAAVAFNRADATFSQQDWTVQMALAGGNNGKGWAVAPNFGKPHTALFETAENVGEGETTLTITLPQNFGTQHTIGRFRLSVTNSPRPVSLTGPQLPKEIADVIAVPAGERSAEQQAKLLSHFASIDNDLLSRKSAVAEHGKQAGNARLRGAQDLTWALINTPSFMFNR